MKRLSATSVYLIVQTAISFLQALVFLSLSIYYVQVVGMNPLQLVLVGTTIEVTIFIFEIPTGVVADTYSRRLSVIIGFALVGLCFILEGAVPLFAAIILAEVIRGVGETFISGAFAAWLTDEIGEAEVGRVFLRAGQVGRIGGIAGTLASVGLGSLNLQLPVILGGLGVMTMSLCLIFVMPEKHFHKTASEHKGWKAITSTASQGFSVARTRPLAFTIIAVGFIYGAYSEGFDRLWEAHFLKDFTIPYFSPVIWFGIISIGGQLSGLVVTEVLIRRFDTSTPTGLVKVLRFCDSFQVMGLIIFALAGNFYLAIAAYWLASNMRQWELYDAWVNQGLDSRVRATVLSFSSQLNALGQFAGGPLVGLIGLTWGIPAALLASALVLSPVILLYNRSLRYTGVAASDSEVVVPARER
ncbi:MAG TPA: MFS transporter [Chloroflexia bacterium]|nr:MFS transporter [Chloroflexia bacterium]